MSYHVHLDVFEGPLELLLHFLEEEKLDIRDIEVSRITQQYLDYLATMREHDLEVAGDFLVMAATLLQIKASALLPEPRVEGEAEQEQIYSRDELIRRLLVYRQFREAGGYLDNLAKVRLAAWPRPFPTLGAKGPVQYTNPIGDTTVPDLAITLANVLANWRTREQVHQIKRQEIDLGVKIGEVAVLIKSHSRLLFDDLLGMQPTKTDIVYTFLAVLELVRQGTIILRQGELYGPIAIIQWKE